MNYINIADVKELSLCNLTTDEELIKVEYPIGSQELFSTEIQPSFTMNFQTDISKDVLDKMCGVENHNKYSIQFDYNIPVQIRKHKKKRINKKWVKRYGYRNSIHTFETDVIEGEYDKINHDFSVETRGCRLIKIDGEYVDKM